LIKRKHPMIYYEAHETVHLPEIYQLLEPLNYKFYWVPVKNYNTNNLNNVEENIFGNSALHSIVAWPANFADLNLPVVQGAYDSLERLYADQGITYTR
jgi:hypothetical protein